MRLSITTIATGCFYKSVAAVVVCDVANVLKCYCSYHVLLLLPLLLLLLLLLHCCEIKNNACKCIHERMNDRRLFISCLSFFIVLSDICRRQGDILKLSFPGSKQVQCLIPIMLQYPVKTD